MEVLEYGLMLNPVMDNMFQTDGVSNSLSKMFGPELSFADKMIERW